MRMLLKRDVSTFPVNSLVN